MPANSHPHLLRIVKLDFRNFDKTAFLMYSDLLRDLVASKFLGKPDFFSEKCFWLGEFQMGTLSIKKESDRSISVGSQSILSAIERLKQYNRCIHILDVGCGPFSILARERSGVEDLAGVACLGVDPLASFYKKLHERYHTGYTLSCIDGTGENLIDYFGKEQFDLVVSKNTIDHSKSPRLIVENMVAILKHKGLLILIGFTKEGSRQGWKGLHKWNIEVSGSDLLLSNKDGSVNKESLTAGLNLLDVSANVYSDCYVLTYIKDCI